MGNETGGYSIKLDGDLFYTDMRQLLEEGTQPVFEPIREDRCVIGPSACIEYCSLLDSVFIGEGCHIGKDCRVGGAPDSALDGKWDLTVLAPDCQLEDGREVAPGIMLDHHGKEVLK